MGAHVDLQRAGTRAALLALGEGADALVGVRLLDLVLGWRGGGRLLLPAGAVVHEVGVQIALAPVPDPTVLTGEDVLYRIERWRLYSTETQLTGKLICEESKCEYYCKLHK